MQEQDHRIFRLSFDLAVPDTVAPAPVQDRLSKLNHHALMPLINQLFSSFCEPSTKIVIDRLELNLGKIPLAELERLMPQKLDEALRSELHRLLQLPAHHHSNGIRKTIYDGYLLEVLSFFLQYGAYPWWYKPDERHSTGQLVTLLAAQYPEAFTQELIRIGHSERVQKRMAATFTDTELVTVVRLLDPVNHEFIQRFSNELQKQHQKTPLVKANQSEFRIAQWIFILQYSIEHRGSVFNQLSFVRQILIKLAQQYRVTYFYLLEKLYAAAAATEPDNAVSDSLSAIISKLWHEALDASPTLSSANDTAPEWQKNLLAGIPLEWQLTAKKLMPFFAAEQLQLPPFQTIGSKIWTALVHRAWKLYPQRLLEWIRMLLLTQASNSPYLLHFPDEVIDKILAKQIPVQYVFIVALREDLMALIKPDWKQPALLKKEINRYYLQLIIGGAGINATQYTIFRYIVSSLSIGQKIELKDWLKIVFANISKTSALPVFSSSIIKLIKTLAIETQVPSTHLKPLKRFFTKDTLGSPQIQDSPKIPFAKSQDLDDKNGWLKSNFSKTQISEIKKLTPEQMWQKLKNLNRLPSAEQVQIPPVLWYWMIPRSQTDIVKVWQKIVKNPDVLHALSMLSDDRTLAGFITRLNPGQAMQLIDLAVVLKEAQGHPQRVIPPQLGFLFLKGILISRGSISNQKNYIKKLLQDWAQAKGIAFEELLRLIWPVVQVSGLGFQHHASFQLFSLVIHENLQPEALLASLKQASPADETSKKPINKPYRKLWDKEEGEPVDPDEVFVVRYAGMILLWPYLGILFERAGLMDEGAFVSEAAQQKAIYLLEYLVSGKAAVEEYHLTLHKVLCAYPLEAPLNIDYTPDETVEALCDGLLSAVIQYWSVLGDTSPEGLREAFLMREGTLSRTGDSWRLQINPASYDILLNQLPWSIAVVNLSWLDKPITVAWI